MPAKEIKELRQSGKLEEAYTMAKAELEAEPDNIWAKRNLAWVLYAYLKHSSTEFTYETFIKHLKELKDLDLPQDEIMLFDKTAWAIFKVLNKLSKGKEERVFEGGWMTKKPGLIEYNKVDQLFDLIKSFHFSIPSLEYTLLHKGFLSCYKGTDQYLPFADWWGLENFRDEDYEKETLPNGKDMMSIAEQAYIAYSKQLLPKHSMFGEEIFDREKAEAFLPKLDHIVENYPNYQYTAYYKAKLLLALGDNENLLSALLPFVKKKRNDFWAWEVLSEAFQDDEEKVLACYCRAFTCKSPEEMLVNLRLKLATLLIKRNLYDEAKTEIERIVAARLAQGWKISENIKSWQSSEWYQKAKDRKSNKDFYKKYVPVADELLYSAVPEESVLVSFVNSDKKMLNFIASEDKFGFFKYERFIDKVNVGDTLQVRFKSGTKDAIYQVYTVSKVNDEKLRQRFLKKIEGNVRISEGKGFGFVNDVFLQPSVVSKYKLTNGLPIKGHAIKTFDSKKNQWGWKLSNIYLQK